MERIKQLSFVFAVAISCLQVQAQDAVANKLKQAWTTFTNDPQLKYALTGISVTDAQTGAFVFQRNGDIGMAPASTQKVITSIAAFETLGASFQYETTIGYSGKIDKKVLSGDLVISASGDPTMASFRYAATQEPKVLETILQAIKKAGIETISGNIVTTNKGFDLNPVPNGWIWGDMGNYYGAGTWGLNWGENQYDVFVKTGSTENSKTELVDSKPAGMYKNIVNDVKTGKAGIGDESVLYADPFSRQPLFQGKLESGKSRFTVSGSVPNADEQALTTIKNYLAANGITVNGNVVTPLSSFVAKVSLPREITTLSTITSPALDSINYWFLRKSVNLYGEALLKTMALGKTGFASTENGVDYLEKFYISNGFDKEAMHIYDGSGLSPANRITPNTLAKALYFAKGKSWFPFFLDALPLYNGMKLKSGTINRVKCFAGYHTSKAGKNYIVAIMVNNYNSSHASLVNKMFTVLDCLK